jgi:hypothetical protein
MNKQESLDPYQDNRKTDQEDLKEYLEQGSDEHSNKDNSHPDENEDNNSFTSNYEVSTNTTTISNNTSHGISNRNHLNGSNRIQATDPCPLPGHLGHNWGQCFQNANNSTTRPLPILITHLNVMTKPPSSSAPINHSNQHEKVNSPWSQRSRYQRIRI